MTVVKELADFLDIARKRGWLDAVNPWRKRHSILLLGTTGVGKTNFVRSILDPNAGPVPLEARTQFPVKDRANIADSLFEIIDTPGQWRHSGRQIIELHEAIKRGVVAVINVVSFGYHEYPTGKPGVTDGTGRVSEEYLEHHRGVELVALESCKSVLRGRLPVFVTLVTKADLWWGSRDDVMHHYGSGDYGAMIEGLADSHVVKPYCSVIHKFYGEGDVSGKFDAEDQVQCRRELLRTLTEMIGRRYRDD
ncbi:MAG: GTPase domain-containing protein [Alphaproteobacteria bacterium]